MHLLIKQNNLYVGERVDSYDRDHMGVYKIPVFINAYLQSAIHPVEQKQ